MRRKFLLTSLLLFCFFAAWIGASYANIWFFESDASIAEKPNRDMAVASEKEDMSVLLSVFDGIPRSVKPLSFEATFQDSDLGSLESILAIKDDSFRQLALDKYVRNLPSDALSDEIRNSLDRIENMDPINNTEEIRKAIEKGKEYLDKVMAVWLERDFEKAKEFILNDLSERIQYQDWNGYPYIYPSINTAIGDFPTPISISNSDFKGKSDFVKSIFPKLLLIEWMKRDKTGCVQFVKSSTSDVQPWASMFVDTFCEKYPHECLYLLSAFRRVWNGNRSGYYKLFEGWYEREGSLVVEAILSAPLGTRRTEMIEVLSRIVAKTNFYDAVALVKTDYPEHNISKLEFLFDMATRTGTKGQAMLDVIRQGDLSNDERQALLRGYINNMSLGELNALSKDVSYRFSEEERFLLIKERLSPSALYKTNVYATIGSIADNEFEMARELFSELSEEHQWEVCMSCCNGANGKLSLLLFDELSPEKQSDEMRRTLLTRLMRVDPALAGEYFERHFQDGIVEFLEEESENKVLKEIIDAYAEADAEAAETWVMSLEDEELKQTALFLLLSTKWRNDPDAFGILLNEIKDEALVDSVLNSILAKEFFFDDQSMMLLVNRIEDLNVTKKIIDKSVFEFSMLSSDTLLDFIDGLNQNPRAQEYAQSRFYELAVGRDPKLALEIALGMHPGEKISRLIQNALSAFQRETPERATRWMIENDIKQE